MTLSSPSPGEHGAGPDAVIRMQFDTAIAKLLVAQTDQLRVLGDSLRDASTAMLHKLQDQVCSQVNETSAAPPKPGLHAMIDELFARHEVQRGLIEWLGEDEARNRARTLVTELQFDIRTGDGNDARTTLNKLLPLYMEALNVRELGEHAIPVASPGGKKDKKMLGNLVLGRMQPFLEQLQMMYSDTVDDGDSFSASKGEELKGTTKRLKAALFVFLNTGNFASHNRGKLTFCQQVELCGAVGAMAETLPVVLHACQTVKTGKKSLATRRALRVGENWNGIKNDEGGQSPIAAYYRQHLADSSRAKYQATLKHMEMVPKARVCRQGPSCRRDDCAESHRLLQALPFNPLAVTLNCPVPKSLWHDFVHENDLCVFNHGELKSKSTLRAGKRILCWAKAECKDSGCLRSHSLAEVCWFNPSFRTEECSQGRECPWKKNCCAFHSEFHKTKRSVHKNEYVGVAEPILFLTRTLKALKKGPSPSPLKTKIVSKATPNQGEQSQISSSEQQKYTRVLTHMETVAKARLCTNEEHYKPGGNSDVCDESHDLYEALSLNPLAMVLPCPTPKSNRDDFLHQNGLCVFHHGKKPVPKEFLKTKNLLCESLDKCKDETCVKSHSVVEICWFFPIFHVNKCPQGDSCKRMETCSLYHSEYHDKRDATMNDTVGNTEPVFFISRAYSELVSKSTSFQSLKDVDDDSVTSWELSEDAGDADDNDEELKKRTETERVKYEQVLEHMKLVPRARVCSMSEDHDNACAKSHSRLEALAFNPLALILKCPIPPDEEHLAQCVFDHDMGPVPKGFVKDKKLLCEELDACSNANCVKSHSIAEVCWFNPKFRVAECPQGCECARKQNCVGFHSEHSERRNARMNSQVGATERALFVERVYAALTKRRLQASHHNLEAELTLANSETSHDDEHAPEVGYEHVDMPNSFELLCSSSD
ncbi:hypothetical protein GN958_ATG15513 [Phytophthora infestans]|uniref:Uncharacterized protein n=1 Tax=Phytophthora infestans TaxID=4787 RepID=A0A8S9U2J2_PHYIN|nr:hypothetical protein GN958_ATG15513 [Phytophthora infestans]